MKPRTYIPTLVLAATLIGLPRASEASGSYSSRPPKPTVQQGGKSKVDAARYDAGKRLYLGRVKLAEPDAQLAATQRAALEELEGLLSPSARKRAKLPELAGRLSAEQLDALSHYVRTRFGK